MQRRIVCVTHTIIRHRKLWRVEERKAYLLLHLTLSNAETHILSRMQTRKKLQET